MGIKSSIKKWFGGTGEGQVEDLTGCDGWLSTGDKNPHPNRTASRNPRM
jgi:hypothetical protein